jgi:hypothetical protein
MELCFPSADDSVFPLLVTSCAPTLPPIAPQDPFKRDSKLHSELANVSRVWPSLSRDSRMSELRARSTASRTSLRSALANDNITGSDKGEIFGHMPPPHHSHKPHLEQHLSTMYSMDPGSGLADARSTRDQV